MRSACRRTKQSTLTMRLRRCTSRIRARWRLTLRMARNGACQAMQCGKPQVDLMHLRQTSTSSVGPGLTLNPSKGVVVPTQDQPSEELLQLTNGQRTPLRPSVLAPTIVTWGSSCGHGIGSDASGHPSASGRWTIANTRLCQHTGCPHETCSCLSCAG
jgi:hypothetical protein